MAAVRPNPRTLTRAFNGGELTPEFFGQIADPKYQTGLATCRNFQVLPHGPVQNRAGFEFVREVKDSTKATRLIPFTYSTTQTFAIEFGEQYFRFHTAGATLLAGTATAWSNATAYVVGDLASRLGVNYYCILAHTNQQPPNATYWYPLPSAAYEIPNPYDEDDLFDVHFVQSADVLTLVHPSYAPRELRRLGATQWTLTTISFASDLTAPGSIAATATVATGTGLTTMRYTVTAVDSTGIEEGLAGTPDDCSNNLSTSGNYNTITWSSVSGAARYNVYKQSNGLYGYIGQTDATSFIDDNITADISKTPPIANDPFNGANNYPAATNYFEQRRAFGGTNTKLQTLWLTRSGTESNLAYSIPTRNDDAISFRIAAAQANTIRHIVALQDLMLLTSSAVWRVTSINTDAITPTSISRKIVSGAGASNVQPVIVDNNNMIYVAARGGHMRELGYVSSAQASGYASGDLSLRAPHLFDGLDVIDLAYAQAPQPIVWAVSSNGDLLGLTYVPEQQVGAWHRHDTYTATAKSAFEAVTAVAEGSEDAVYVVVRRYINGGYKRYIERLHSRAFDELDDAFFVDSGATYDDPKTITAITKANPGVATSTAHGFSNGDVVDLSGIEGMTELNSVRVIVANAAANTFELTDEDGNNIDTSGYTTYLTGGYAREAVNSIASGLSHLEGETVSILADGAVMPQQTVSSGTITLPDDIKASRIHIGLPIEADIETLPLALEGASAFGQGRQKNVNKVWLRVYRSGGIFAGPSFTKLTEAKIRTDEVYGSPPDLKTGEVAVVLTPTWADSGTVCARQSDPLPLTITSMTLEVSVGA